MFRATLAVAVADLRRRTRSPTLLVAGLLTAYLGKLIVVDGELVVAGSYTGTGTAAWYGGAVCGLGTAVLVVVGFPLVRGGVTHDRDTGVATLLATSPLGDAAYLLGKFLSAFAALAVVTAVLGGATTAAFLLGGTGPLDLLVLWEPFALLTLPAMAVVAAAAVLTETVGPLRGTAGTAAYVVGTLAVVVAGAQGSLPFDLSGLGLIQRSVIADVVAQHPTVTRPVEGFAYRPPGGETTAFEWSGLAWTPAQLLDRAATFAVAGGLLAAAWAAFDRFDPDGGLSLPTLGGDASEGTTAEPPAADDAARPAVDDAVAALPTVETGRFGLLAATLAEVRMALRRRRAWYGAVAAVVVGSLVGPAGPVRSLLVPVGTLLALPALSGLGSRERRADTARLLFTTASPVGLLVPTFLSGVAVVAVVVGPAAIRFLTLGETGAVIGLAGAAVALPAAAVAVGVWTARPRAFETVLLLAWYLGPVNGVAPLDFLGARPATVAAGVPYAYLAAAPVLLAVAAVGRRR
ncbi:ABC transporter permease [Halobaculum sp. MBLA0143]|uniref:ABC transporter permease n=1 Tax=Halobaculum sp. MBLA0143 TaxID=3079933 RepID=UPI0035236433